MTIGPFVGENRWLSNFYSAPVKAVWFKDLDVLITEEGGETHHPAVLVDVPTVEHGYVLAKHVGYGRGALKSVGVGFADFRQMPPGEVKRLGRKIPLRGDWDKVRVDVMRWLLAQKFAPGSNLGWKLINTESEDIVELNTWHDLFWGVCQCSTHNGAGENRLGELLMERRAELQRLRLEIPVLRRLSVQTELTVRFEGGRWLALFMVKGEPHEVKLDAESAEDAQHQGEIAMLRVLGKITRYEEESA